jgi:endonuclease/exonuclease/phosphatase family metal-dependent hydrolase
MLTRRRADITEIAEAEGLSLRYAPSMRNGLDRSDRGNAVLSSIPIGRTRALLLPYVRQRRVAVAVTLDGVADVRVASAHLDTGGQARAAAERVAGFGGGRAAQAAALGRQLESMAGEDGSVVLGADLNSAFGVRDPALLALVRQGLHIASRHGNWWHTYHGAIPLLLDHVLFRSAHRRITSVCVTRLDEAPGDRSRGVFGSDHHPLLARVEFGAPAALPPRGSM